MLTELGPVTPQSAPSINSTTAPTTNTNVTNTANPATATSSANPANVGNPTNQQQPPKPGTAPNTATPFSLTSPQTATTINALADTKSAADVTKVLADPNHQKIITGYINHVNTPSTPAK